MSQTPERGPAASFAPTRWTVVMSAGQGATPQARLALEELCTAYWYPLYTYIRRQGHSREDAEDLTQAFFARFLEKNYLLGLSSEKGKFRAFLLSALNHFLANEWDKSGRQKRGGRALHLSWDLAEAETRYLLAPAADLTPERIYDREWAVTLLERVLHRLGEGQAREGKGQIFEQLRPFLAVAKTTIPYAEAAAALGTTTGAVKVAVHRLRRRYRALLRDEIAQTLTCPAQIEEEIRALFAVFGG